MHYALDSALRTPEMVVHAWNSNTQERDVGGQAVKVILRYIISPKSAGTTGDSSKKIFNLKIKV